MLSYPLARGSDADPGGAADLQTDVMRFMAILSLCLVAIFALVQSIPPSDVPVVAAPRPAEPIPPVAKLQPDPEPVQRPRPIQEPVPKPAQVAVEHPPAPASIEKPAPRPVETGSASPVEPAPEPPVAPTPIRSTTPAQQGFMLRFESDTALTALVARNEVGLYAIRGDNARRLSIERGRLEFWTSSLPSRYHEMDAPTVPAALRRALRGGGSGDLRWGVTLPATMAKQLNGYLESGNGGEIVIGADGRLRLE